MTRLVVAVPLVALVGALGFPAAAPAARWPEIPREQREALSPQVESDADAEALFWEYRAEDRFEGNGVVTEIHQHLRVRVFTERGAERYSRVEIPYGHDQRIHDVEARTMLPDGRAVEVRAEDVFERTTARGRGRTSRLRAFTFPQAAPGAILEYRWREVRLDDGGMNMGVTLQRDLPVQRLVVRIKPILLPNGPSLRFSPVNAAMPPFRRDPDGYHTSEMTRVPAFRPEPMMPPAAEVSVWLGLYYVDDTHLDPARYWSAVSRRLHEIDRAAIAVTPAIRAAADRIAGGAATEEETLRRLYEHCRREIRNLDEGRLSDEARARLRLPRSAHETLERGEGSSANVQRLFAALAIARGFDARIARTADREHTFFRESVLLPGLLSGECVAVKVGGAWRFHDPGASAVPAGMLRWQIEDQRALIPDPRELVWARTPRTPAAGSHARRIGVFRLDADGALEGNVRIEYSGHLGIEQKADYADLDDAGREERVRGRLRERVPSAEVGSVRLVHADGPELPVRLEFAIRVPDFATPTGRRLLVQPAVFQRGQPALFSAERRVHPVDFRFAWSEYDSLLIELPEGWSLEDGEAPAGHALGEFGRYAVRIGLANEGRLLVHRREFAFDGVRFGRDAYPGLREGFAVVRERDGHALALARASDAP